MAGWSSLGGSCQRPLGSDPLSRGTRSAGKAFRKRTGIVTRRRGLGTGAAGRLAAAVVREFADAHDEVVAHTRASLDVTDLDAVRQTIDAVRPQAIVNCAAFNDVDGAEDKATDAFAINAFAVRSLARAAESV